MVMRYRETENTRQDESRFRDQGLSPESVVCRHLSWPKGPGNPLPSDEFIGNLWRGMGDAKDLLFRLNLTACARKRGVKLCGKGRATFNARAIKVEDIRNQQRMFPYGFLVRLNLKSSVVCATRNGATGRGKAKLALSFYLDCGFSFMPYKAINTDFYN